MAIHRSSSCGPKEAKLVSCISFSLQKTVTLAVTLTQRLNAGLCVLAGYATWTNKTLSLRRCEYSEFSICSWNKMLAKYAIPWKKLSDTWEMWNVVLPWSWALWAETLHTYLAREKPWSPRGYSGGEACPLHFGRVDLSDHLKCRWLECVISWWGGLRSR